jgi:hypothetical protein
MIPMLNFAARQTLIAAIDCDAIFLHRLVANQSFGQSAGNGLKGIQLIAAKEVGMSQSAALKRSLQQLKALVAVWEVFECHLALI